MNKNQRRVAHWIENIGWTRDGYGSRYQNKLPRDFRAMSAMGTLNHIKSLGTSQSISLNYSNSLIWGKLILGDLTTSHGHGHHGFRGFSHPRASSMAAAHAQRERSSDENSSTRSAAAILDDLDGSGWIWMNRSWLHPQKCETKKQTPQTVQKTSREFRFHLCNDFHQFLTVSKVQSAFTKTGWNSCSGSFARFQQLRTSSSCRSLTPQQLRQLRSIRIQQQSIVVTLRDTWRFSDQIQIRFHHEKSSLTRVD